MRIVGVDFTSAPRRGKCITAAHAVLRRADLELGGLEEMTSFDDFERLLSRPAPWMGGFDFPFGLPREAVRALEWPEDWNALVGHCERIGRAGFKQASDQLRMARPEGNKYPKRRGDDLAKSHSPMKCVRPPVGWMFVEGAPRLLRAGVTIVPMQRGDAKRIAIEAYPGFTVRALIGREPYKHDQPAKQTRSHRERRRALLDALADSRNPTAVRLRAGKGLRRRMLEDGTGDLLDAAICAMQAAWSWQRRDAGFGLPPRADSLEGWIATVPGA